MNPAARLKLWLKNSFRRRMIARAMFTAGLSALAVGVAGFLIVRHLEQTHNNDIYFKELENVGDSIATSISSIVRDLEILANTPPIQGLARTAISGGVDPIDGSSTQADWEFRLTSIFKSFHNMRPEYMQIRLIGLADNGKEIVRVDKDADQQVVILGKDRLQEKADEPYFKAVLQLEEGEAYKGRASWNREFGQIQEPRIAVTRYAVPVFAEDGTRFGMIAINVLAAPFVYKALDRANIEHDVVLTDGFGTAFLYDAKTSTVRGFINQPVPLASELIAFMSSGATQPEVKNVAGWTVARKSLNHATPGEAVLAISVLVPTKAANFASRVASSILVGCIVVLMAISMIVSTIGTQKEIAPILRMNEAIARSRSGTERPKLPLDRTDEIGELARSFDGLVEELIVREKRAKTIFDGVSDGVIISDENGVIQDVNPAITKMFDFTQEQMVGRNVGILMSAADHQAHDRQVAHYHATGERKSLGKTVERHAVHKTGAPFPIELTVSPIEVDGGRFYAGVLRDITARKAQEAERLSLIEALEASNEELNSFAHVASHDLQAPLRAIHKVSNWIEEDLGDHENEEMTENLGLLRSRVERMSQLLDDLLEHAKIGRKTGATNSRLVSGAELRDELTNLVHLPATLDLVFDPEFDRIVIHKMPIRIVLLNLIGNAIKHDDSPGGEIRVSVKIFAEHYEFSVSDDGPGIDPQYHERIFGMFQTLKSRDIVEGSGMGLAICRKHITLHGGEIRVASSGDGTGSTFTFTWPREAEAGKTLSVA